MIPTDTHHRRWTLLAGLLLGCSSPLYASRDAAPRDTGLDLVDQGVDDVAPTGDHAPSDDVVPRHDPCAAAAVIDLDVYGETRGNITRITRDNRDVPDPEGLLVGGCGRPGHEVVFRYTPRLSRWLRVSTNNPGTDVTLDTVAWALPACTVTAAPLGCSDDNGVAPRAQTSAFTTTENATTGIPVFVVVAGRVPPRPDATSAQGAFELTVTELPPVLAGGSCDPVEAINHCLQGYECRAAAGATTGTCTGTGS